MTARGAALLAGIAVGIYTDAVEAAARTYRPTQRYGPAPTRHAAYEHAYRNEFLKLYPTLRSLPLAVQ